MRLSSLTLQGFKSFGNRTTIEFAAGITAIIGPNGAGKSNVIDALRWTTGGGRAREFRASDKTDLIFHGAAGKRSVGLAEVEVELEGDHGSVKVYRSLDREGTMRLRLNGRNARLLDVDDALTGSGLGRAGLSIIGQGEVSQVLMADPAKLLDYVAEAAGVARLSGRRDQTAARLDTAAGHLDRLQDVLIELEARCEALAEEARGAKRHAELSAASLQLRFTIAEVRHRGLHAELRELTERRGALEAALLDGRERLVTLRNGTKTAADQRDASEERFRKAAAALEYRRGNLRLAHERLARLDERVAAQQAQSDAASAELRRLEELRPPSEPEQAPQQARELAELALEQEQSASAELAAASAEEELRREALEQLRSQRAGAEREAATLASRRESLAGQMAQVEQQLAALAQDPAQAELPTLTAESQAAAAALSEVEQRLEAQRAELQTVHEQHALLTAEAVSRTNAAERLRAAFEARRGYAQGPRNALSSGLPGVIGSVADLVKVPSKYQEAIAGALGRRAEYVVVDDAETAQAVLEHVRRVGGFVTVMPLDLLRSKHDRGLGSVTGQPGVLAAATDVITTEKRFATLFEQLLGGTAVVESLPAATTIARRNAQRPRLVTLDGDIVESSGAMSGGKRSQQHTVLGAAADLEEAEAAADASARAAAVGVERLATAQALTRRLLDELGAATKANRAAAVALAAARERSAGHERLHADLEARAAQLQAEQNALDAAAPAADTQHSSAQADELAATEQAAATAVADLDTARAAAADARVRAAAAKQALALVEERWRSYQADQARFATSSERAQQLREELVAFQYRRAELERELTEATAARDLAQAALPEGVTAEEQALKEARAALLAAESALNAETELQSNRAQELEEAKVQAARRETALELAQDELATFTAGIALLELSERAAKARLRDVSEELEGLGAVNHRAVADLSEVSERKETLEVEAVQATLAVSELQAALERIDKETSSRLGAALSRLQASFGTHVQQLFGTDGKGGIEVEMEGSRPVGVRIRLQPPGKQTQSLHLLSVGERTMGALAFLFALMADEGGGLPVAILDEVDAPLDEANIRRYGSFVTRLAKQGTQFVLITHQKATFEIAETLWGVTTEQGVSRVFGIKREDHAFEPAAAL